MMSLPAVALSLALPSLPPDEPQTPRAPVPDYTQEITVAAISEADLLAGKPNYKRYLVAK